MFKRLISYFLAIVSPFKRAQSTNEAFLDQWIIAYHDELFRCAVNYVKCKETAENIVRNAFEKLCKQGDITNSNLAAKNYLYKVTLELVFDHLHQAAYYFRLQEEISGFIHRTQNLARKESVTAETQDLISQAVTNLFLTEEILTHRLNSIP